MENVSDESVQAMDKYFTNLSRAEVAGKAGYSMIAFMLSNYFSWYWGENGNCAYWTSQGLVQAGLLDGNSAFPKVVFIKLYFKQLQLHKWRRLNPYCHIVFYHAADDPRDRPPTGWLHPGHWRSAHSSIFNQLSRFAHAIVRVDTNTGVASVSRRRPWRPFSRRNGGASKANGGK